MAEGDSHSSSFSDIANNSILLGLVYSSAKISKGDASSIALLSLPSMLLVGDIRPYCFEPEQETSSEAEEMPDLAMDSHFGKRGLVIQLGSYIYKTNHFVCLVHLKPFAVRCKCSHCQPMPMARDC